MVANNRILPTIEKSTDQIEDQEVYILYAFSLENNSTSIDVYANYSDAHRELEKLVEHSSYSKIKVYNRKVIT